MAELGQTKDPKELIPGDPGAVTSSADDLRGKAKIMQGVADDLGNIRIPTWEGQASSAFWDKFSPEKKNWELGHDAMDSVAKTLDDHSSTLSWAQGQASEAIDLWERGEQATKKAAADFEANGGSFNPGMDPSAPPGTPGGAEPIGGEFTDPGAKLRQQAQEVLERARKQLEDAGNTSASSIDDQGGKGKGAPGWLSGPADHVDQKGPQKVARDLTEAESWADKAKRQQENYRQGEGGNRFAKYGQWGEEFGKKSPEIRATLVGAKAEASLFKADAKGATQLGDVTVAGSAEVKALSADAGASAGIGRDGAFGQAKAGAYLLDASARGSAHYGIAEVGGSARGYVGAEAGAEGSIGPKGVNVGANAFAGAKAVGDVHGDVGGVGAGVTGEAWAGAGAEANATLGQNEDGEWKIGAEAGIGLGVGAKLGGEVTIDPQEIGDTVGDAASKINPFD
ncbi:MAG: hypothetical protein GEU98_15045 [Pseudonocardiaceae bacterium]|nr:hypothetical protein [Pseudonocardiaceae bacterium]